MTRGPSPSLDDLTAITPVLLRTLEALALVARFFHPPGFADVMAAAGAPDEDLKGLRPRLDAWPPSLADLRAPLAEASDLAIDAFAALRTAKDITGVFRALRGLGRARAALYPLAKVLPPISRYFLDSERRDDPGLAARLAAGLDTPDQGVFHVEDGPGSRGGYALYCPEYDPPEGGWPLVMALHGGAGSGRAFLWSWLTAARSWGALVVCPTAVGDTWALAGEDADTPNLNRILTEIEGRWPIDPRRKLLSGMSDGGTFTLVSGLESASPFTHLAPIATGFHPILVQMADPDRLAGLPIFLIHGALDWMFPVDLARQGEAALRAAGAKVTYAEIDTLSHSYPGEMNGPILNWMGVE